MADLKDNLNKGHKMADEVKENENQFTELAGISHEGHIEKKGKFSYLSWPFAVESLLSRFPDAKIKEHLFKDELGLTPVLNTPNGAFVKVSVEVNGVKRSKLHPILDNHNRPIESPSSFEVNTSLARCLVKTIALHGLGLYIYAGEDLPNGEESKVSTPKQERAEAIVDEAMPASWRQVNSPLGKYKGESLGDIYENDPNYLSWMVKNVDAKTDKLKMGLAGAAKALNEATADDFVGDDVAEQGATTTPTTEQGEKEEVPF